MSAGHQTTTGPLPIGQFAQLVQQTVKNDPMFQHQALAGEISSWSVHNGNVYFTLRDNDGQMDCVIWRNARLSVDPSIKVGSEVIIIGSVDVWPKRGRLQIVVARIQPVQTLGAMEETKRQLVADLKAEGALDIPPRRLPFPPKHVAIVTGTDSAALSDMKRLMANRWPDMRTTVIGVLVQGEHAAREIVRGLAITRQLAQPDVAQRLDLPPVDVVIVGRGGGSPEDLWAFNLEPVVRAILASPVPVISAVGHEQDHLVSDLVADVRASTPSNAIERLVPDRNALLQLHDELDERVHAAVVRRIGELRQRLNLLANQLTPCPWQRHLHRQRTVDGPQQSTPAYDGYQPLPPPPTVGTAPCHPASSASSTGAGTRVLHGPKRRGARSFPMSPIWSRDKPSACNSLTDERMPIFTP
jgi:exodeoxyribonuclease VII large subunit